MFLATIILCISTSIVSGDFLKSDSEQWINRNRVNQLILKHLENEPDANQIYLRMFDASSKIPSGILGGNFFDLGHFDECYGIQGKTIQGKYCLGLIPLQNIIQIGSKELINPRPRMIGGPEQDVGFYWSICVPSTVSADQLNAVVLNITNNAMGGIIKFQEQMCYCKDTEPSLSTGAILTITTLALFVAISLASTLYDIFLFYTNRVPTHERLIAFSYLSNGRKLIKSNKNPDHLLCLNGIRAITMMWVILAHVYTNAFSAPMSNFFEVVDWNTHLINMIIYGSTVSVDTFFAVGGLVTAYAFLNTMDKGHKFNIFMYYLHRFLRLTPAYGIAILIHYNLVVYMGNGPLWNLVGQSLSESCKETWWSSLLYFANFMQKGFCIPPTWYLQVDMQFFILSPLVLIPLMKTRKLAYFELGALTIGGILVPFCLGYFDDIKAPGLNSGRGMYKYYAVPQARFGPYVIGMIFGVVLHTLKKSKPKSLNHWLILALWIGTLATLTACVFGGFDFRLIDRRPEADNLWANAFFLGFNRNGWALAVCLLIYLCVSGYGGPINYFLSIPIFQFISKLSYSIFLVHYGIIMMLYAASRNNIKVTNATMMFSFWGYFMLTLLVSTVLCLTFESPVLVVEKCFFGKAPKPIQKNSVSKNDSYDV